ncbi:Glutamate--tRNA ligase mitochondrial [Serendipita sp. 398]|nr:Glutamate--tRNA ligase mitochondrial [Serendipita sp. 398]
MPPLLRFAPSPTGSLHLGGLRTALFNHLFAQNLGGKWILRIEDTDASRYIPGSVEDIQNGLKWAGLEYDFGPNKNGPHGPYYQSQRLDLYHSYVRKLIESGDAYRCFCSSDELEVKRQHLKASGSLATYDRACRKLTEEDVARRIKLKQPHVVRIDDVKDISLPPFTDMIFGEVRDAQGSLPTDPILLKMDQFPTYHLASVVDDHEMGITHVLRGEEWLPSLPLHRSLYNRLGWTAPAYGHLPLLLNPDGSKMSKRHGDVRVSDFKEKGWESSAILNWLALSGRNANNKEPRSSIADLQMLVKEFKLSDYTRRRAVLDPELLSQLNRRHIQLELKKPERRHEILDRTIQVLKPVYPHSEPSMTRSDLVNPDYVTRVLELLEDRLDRIDELPAVGRIFFEGTAALTTELPCKPHLYLTVTSGFLDWVEASPDLSQAKSALNRLPGELGVSKGQYMRILRHALGGEKNGPPVGEVLSLIGKGEVKNRLRTMLASDALAVVDTEDIDNPVGILVSGETLKGSPQK